MSEKVQPNLNPNIMEEFLDFVYENMSAVYKKDGLSEREQAFNFLQSIQRRYRLALTEDGIKVTDR